MSKRFIIHYTIAPQHNSRALSHCTNDPVEAEEFLTHLLICGARITGIEHDAMPLTEIQFDRMVRIAAEAAMSQMLATSLHLDTAAIRHRFHFAT